MAGPQCCENPPLLDSKFGSGNVGEVAGLKAYFSGSPDSKRTVLLISDLFGYAAPNLRKFADKVAAAGFYVVVPDYFFGDPYVPDKPERPIPVWVKDHGVDKGFENSKPIIEALKSKGATSIGASGYCWGAKVVVELAKCGLIQAAVLCHPTFVTVDDIKEVKVPISVLGAEIDKFSPPELLKQFEDVLAAKPEVEGFVKIFPKVAHGWTMRNNIEDQESVKSANEAHADTIHWFTKFLN